MSDPPLTWMAAALRENGLRVREVKGWKTRGRPSSFSPRGVVFHHTASNAKSGAAPALGICVKGRSDLPGPLCNVMVGRDGTVYLIAAGRANHAGLGGPLRSIPKDSGNMYMAGVEVENDGVGEPFRKELLQVCEVVFATLLLGLRRRAKMLVGHKEWAPHRKSDPARIDMDQFRHRVAQEIRAIKLGKQEPKTEPKKGPQQPQKPRPTPAPALDTHVVEAGDTLFAIATRRGMSVQELMELNGLQDTVIRPGDKLKVRGKSG